jgi:hypothetical protein
MRTPIALALTLLFVASLHAQSQRPGIFGMRPVPGSGPTVTPDANKFPIPQGSVSMFKKLSNLLPKFNAPLSQPVIPQSQVPSYYPLMPVSYLKAFHYLPAGTRSQLQ